MQKIPKQLAEQMSKEDIFGYSCDQGAVIGDAEFIIWAENDEYFLVHNSEIQSQGFLIKLRKKSNANHK